MEYLALACRALIGAVFLVSAATKLTSPVRYRSFQRATRRMRVVPRALVKQTAVLVVVAEVAIVVLMAIPLTVSALAGFVVALGLLGGFTVGIVVAVRDGDTEPCSCFGKSTTPMGPQHVGRNAFLLLVAAAGLVGAAVGGPLEFGLAAVAVVGGLVFGGLVTMFDDLYELFRPTPATTSSRHG
ncbi:MauE/DoxX family redox-associated membrane protein [Phytomonospora sp. NPDC050363]|uniref:MauE/DoxX family redox-associated membrane protein n=1 Tax=Phytomonospora sp. NPDC050363 TaxID=3155642 RepID=UPI003409F97F